MIPSSDLQVEDGVMRLPEQVPHRLLGYPSLPVTLPENLLCFCRRTEAELNSPRQGRALHHRHVLIAALRTAATVCVDDRAFRLNSGEGLLVLPFQFHHYLHAERNAICWLFITFDLEDDELLQKLRFRPFALTPEIKTQLGEIVQAFREAPEGERSRLHLALLLAGLKQLATRAVAGPRDPRRIQVGDASQTSSCIAVATRLEPKRSRVFSESARVTCALVFAFPAAKASAGICADYASRKPAGSCASVLNASLRSPNFAASARSIVSVTRFEPPLACPLCPIDEGKRIRNRLGRGKKNRGGQGPREADDVHGHASSFPPFLILLIVLVFLRPTIREKENEERERL